MKTAFAFIVLLLLSFRAFAQVSSFNGRTGAVSPQAGDYTAAQINQTQSGIASPATTTQQAKTARASLSRTMARSAMA
jgi:hypothetical protein